MAPKNAYCELLPQPDIITAYTLIEDTAIIYNIPMFHVVTTSPSPNGITAQDNSAIVRPKIGDTI